MQTDSSQADTSYRQEPAGIGGHPNPGRSHTHQFVFVKRNSLLIEKLDYTTLTSAMGVLNRLALFHRTYPGTRCR